MSGLKIRGKGMYIWNAWVADTEYGSAAHAVDVAKAAGITHVLIKIADGMLSFNVKDGRDYAREFVEAFRADGILVIGWQYIYGGRYYKAEAIKAVERIQQLGLEYFVVNAEHQFKEPGKAAIAEYYMNYLRRYIPALKIGLSTYRYPTLHREFPYQAFMKQCDFTMPQVYWMKATNSAAQLVRSYKEWQAITDKPFIPTGAAFQQDGWRAKPSEILSFLEKAVEMGFEAANFWVWEHARRYPELWAAISAFRWPSDGAEHHVYLPIVANGEQVVEQPSPVTVALPNQKKYRVNAPNGLRVRTAPDGVQIASLKHGTIVSGAEQGDWVKLDAYSAKAYLEERQ